MTKLLFFCERFPLVLDFDGLIAPLLSDDLGDLRICKTWILRDDLGLMMLAIKDEGLVLSVSSGHRLRPGSRTVARSRDLRIRLTDADLRS